MKRLSQKLSTVIEKESRAQIVGFARYIRMQAAALRGRHR
jgi:hypothetical protein